MTGPTPRLPEGEPLPPKPVTQGYWPERTRLPRLTRGLRWRRRLLQGLARLLVRLLTRCEARGLEHIPPQGPLLLTVNHLGDADALVVLAHLPWQPDVLAAMELYDIKPVRWLLNAYGAIWVHRGRPDRRALKAALQALEEGRVVALAPEGRQSVTRSLEPGTEGAAFLALKARVPVLPVALTGTEDENVFGHLKRGRRPKVSVTFGPPFTLDDLLPAEGGLRQALPVGTERIMLAIARLLPPRYQGVYRARVAAQRDQTSPLPGSHGPPSSGAAAA